VVAARFGACPPNVTTKSRPTPRILTNSRTQVFRLALQQAKSATAVADPSHSQPRRPGCGVPIFRSLPASWFSAPFAVPSPPAVTPSQTRSGCPVETRELHPYLER